MFRVPAEAFLLFGRDLAADFGGHAHDERTGGNLHAFGNQRAGGDHRALADAGAGFLDAVLSQFNQPMHVFFDALARLGAFDGATPEQRTATLAKVDDDLRQLRGWAEAAPINFAQKVALIEAERLRVLGQHRGARDRYEEAIELAQAHEFTSDEALACEAAGRFHLELGRRGMARHFLKDAYDVYVRWGAHTKAAALEAAHPEIVPTGPAATSNTTTTTGTWGGTRQGGLELATILKASQAISTEVVLPNLLRRLISTVMECAGAERAVLLLERDDQLYVEAEGKAGADEILVTKPAAVERFFVERPQPAAGRGGVIVPPGTERHVAADERQISIQPVEGTEVDAPGHAMAAK